MNYVMKPIEIEGIDPDPRIQAAYTPDGAYIGNEEWAKELARRGIVPELREGCTICSIGFCEAEQKWYGWSHRAIYGFGIGSTVKKGDCGYTASTPEEMIEDRGAFFRDISEESARRAMDECQVLPDRSGIRILHAPLFLPMANSITEAVDAVTDGDLSGMEVVDIHADSVSVRLCGRGEWTARTLDDAKQMACDFAEGVS